jgi:radical SAM protein with 4Fe4S-binding SPASM domain
MTNLDRLKQEINSCDAYRMYNKINELSACLLCSQCNRKPTCDGNCKENVVAWLSSKVEKR